MVWQYSLHYGDRDFLARHFEPMKRYVDFLGTQATNHILPKYGIGDWGTAVKGWKEGEPVSVVTAFYYYDTVIPAKTAEVLGKRAEAAKYRSLAADIKRAFNRKFYDPKTKNYEQGTEFSNAFPLFLGLVPAGDESAVLQNILSDIDRNQGHFTVGVLGAKYLLEALTTQGRADAAYRLVTQTGYPGWAHLLEGSRTTLSEFWDLHGSHNHVMLGSVDGSLPGTCAESATSCAVYAEEWLIMTYFTVFWSRNSRSFCIGMANLLESIVLNWAGGLGQRFMATSAPASAVPQIARV